MKEKEKLTEERDDKLKEIAQVRITLSGKTYDPHV